MHIWGAYYIVLWYGQTIEEMFAVFSSFCCYLVDKLIYIIYELYDEISLLHLFILKVYVTSSYLESSEHQLVNGEIGENKVIRTIKL